MLSHWVASGSLQYVFDSQHRMLAGRALNNLSILDTGLILERSSDSVPCCRVSTGTIKRPFLVFLGRTEVKDKELIYGDKSIPLAIV